MASESLTVQISPQLLESMGIEASGPVDYFTLLGVENRDDPDLEALAANLQARSRALRHWQTSPQYRKEVVHLLRVLQQASRILRDPQRRELYAKSLAGGAQPLDAQEGYSNLLRAALADNRIDEGSRRRLNAFAEQYRLDQVTIQRLTRQVREDLDRSRVAAVKVNEEDQWEFRLAGEGEEPFCLELYGMEASGKFDEATPAQMLARAAGFGISAQRAGELIREFQRVRYEKMVERVAGGGAVSDVQAEMLLAKAPTFGLDRKQATEIVSNYTLGVVGAEADYGLGEDTGELFPIDSDAERVQSRPAAQPETAPRPRTARPGTRKTGGLHETIDQRTDLDLAAKPVEPTRAGTNKALLIGGAVVAVLVIAAAGILAMRGGEGRTDGKGPTGPGAVQPAADTASNAGAAADGIDATAAPTPTPDLRQVRFASPTEPLDGMLMFAPEAEGDPPRFTMLSHEVTCGEYHEYIRDTLEPQPEGWKSDGMYPDGRRNHPVTNVSWHDATGYCRWLATQRGWDPDTVRLPSHEEFLRAVRGHTLRSNPLSDDYWAKVTLWTRGLQPARANNFDRIFLGRSEDQASITYGTQGRIYDLMGNVAEWGRDQQGSQRVILGGDHQQSDPNFDPLKPRWRTPKTVSPTIGFRYVHVPDQRGEVR